MYLAAREHWTYEALMAPHGDRFPVKTEYAASQSSFNGVSM
jgi:hypothetical protein